MAGFLKNNKNLWGNPAAKNPQGGGFISNSPVAEKIDKTFLQWEGKEKIAVGDFGGIFSSDIAESFC